MLYKAVLSTFLVLSLESKSAQAGEVAEDYWLCREANQPKLEVQKIDRVLDAFMMARDPSGHLRSCTNSDLLEADDLDILDEMSLQWRFEMADDSCVVYEFWRNGDEGPAFVRKLRKPKVMPEPEEPVLEEDI